MYKQVYGNWLKELFSRKELATHETTFKVSCLAEAIHHASDAMCRKAFLGCSGIEPHLERRYGNQYVSIRFERQ